MNMRGFKLLLLISIIGALLASVTMAAAQSGPEDDGRINAAAEFEYAIYCVDANNVAANAYSEGGIRVLNAQGQEVLFVSNETIVDAGDHPAVNLLLGESATVPGLALYRLTDGGFQLNGFDLHGKAFTFAFYSCAPILPPQSPDEPEDDEDECEFGLIFDIAFKGQAPQGNGDFDICCDQVFASTNDLINPCCLLGSFNGPLEAEPIRISERLPMGPILCCAQIAFRFSPPQGVPPNPCDFRQQVNYT